MNGKFAAYYRVSTTKQGVNGLGMEAQRDAVRTYLNGGNWNLIAEFAEVESGKRNNREELAKALALCRKEKATLLIAKLDRLARNAAFLLSLRDSGVDFIAVDEEGIAIIDQHVAHERVLFERITERLTNGRLESQRLLDPILIELPPSGRQALVSRAADLDRLGFEVEEFGGDTLRVSAFPALLTREECAAALRALSEDLEGLDRGTRVEEAIKRIAATMACHAAVKANYPLTHEKMLHILDELRRTAYSTICPHGRPVMLRLTRREVERNFQRI